MFLGGGSAGVLYRSSRSKNSFKPNHLLSSVCLFGQANVARGSRPCYFLSCLASSLRQLRSLSGGCANALFASLSLPFVTSSPWVQPRRAYAARPGLGGLRMLSQAREKTLQNRDKRRHLRYLSWLFVMWTGSLKFRLLRFPFAIVVFRTPGGLPVEFGKALHISRDLTKGSGVAQTISGVREVRCVQHVGGVAMQFQNCGLEKMHILLHA